MAGNVSTPSLSAAIRIDRIEPPAPTGLVVPTPTKLPHLTWTQASDAATGGSGIGEYHVYRNGVRVGIVAIADFQDTTVTLDDVYGYTVTAVDGAGNESAPSSAATVLFDHTPAPRARRPERPDAVAGEARHGVGVGRPRRPLRLRVLRDLPRRRRDRHHDEPGVHRHRPAA